MKKNFVIFLAGMVVMLGVLAIIGHATLAAASRTYLEQDRLRPTTVISYSNYYGQLMTPDPTSAIEQAMATEWRGNEPLDPAKFSAMVLSSVLSDPHGWAAADITFKPGDSPTPHITFEWLFPDEMKKYCDGNSDALGCTRQGGPDQCTVYLSVSYPNGSPNWYDSPAITTQLINHEVGHCLGFSHTKGGLMDPRDGGESPLPSTAQIYNVSERLIP